MEITQFHAVTLRHNQTKQINEMYLNRTAQTILLDERNIKIFDLNYPIDE